MTSNDEPRYEERSMSGEKLVLFTYDARQHIATRVPVLMVGNFISSSTGTREVCEDLASELIANKWEVLATSREPQRLPRLLDMMGTAWLKRNQYEVAQVDVYGGQAFYFAERVCWVLRKAGKPYVLTLHGGSLPEFARKKKCAYKTLVEFGRCSHDSVRLSA